MAEELGLGTTAEPTEGEVGRLIRRELSRDEMEPEALALLFAADRVRHQAALRDVVCERYVYSSLAYQAAEGLDPEWLCEVNRGARAPDVAVLIDVDPEVALERVRSGRDGTEKFERDGFLRSVEGEYRAMFRGEEPWLSLGDGYGFFDTELRVVDGDAPVEEVTERVLDAVRDAL